MKVTAITQARCGSTRLPAKVLRTVGRDTLLDIHIKRILEAREIDDLVVATTDEDSAEKIVEIAEKHGARAYKGAIDDVLERFYLSIVEQKPDLVVRLTSDCPLIDPRVIDQVVDACKSGEYDYVSNTLQPTFPDGVDVEVFKFSALKKAFDEATLKSDREHVTPYIWRNSTVKGGSLFKSLNIANLVDYSKYRITVDTIEDFEVIKYLIEELGQELGWKEYIDFLDKHPQIKQLNNFHERNEGYAKSLLNDK
ncbi:glycosyltransferase family protein [Butyricimonas sp.]|uniref:glycosyltransferase family protein n=1 Tax=Butyricimonas sp. TaxID=1969738 RepID=UPI0025C589A0|nr:glycosyltransferase family protein [Butyricimonas sp.]